MSAATTTVDVNALARGIVLGNITKVSPVVLVEMAKAIMHLSTPTIDHRAVYEFTRQSAGEEIPNKPRVITWDEVDFLIRMLKSESFELACTVTGNVRDAHEFVLDPRYDGVLERCGIDSTPTLLLTQTPEQAKELADKLAKDPQAAKINETIQSKNYDAAADYCPPETLNEIIAEQADALIDMIYYILNVAARAGINLNPVFAQVHLANMAKRFPDGDFHRREIDGKIIKPPGWNPPNIVPIIEEQERNGSWGSTLDHDPQ